MYCVGIGLSTVSASTGAGNISNPNASNTQIASRRVVWVTAIDIWPFPSVRIAEAIFILAGIHRMSSLLS
jgi:hypothetical protein